MERTFTQYAALPVGEDQLKMAGWTKHNIACDPHFGFVWTEDPSGASKRNPLKLYTTAGGQPSGVGVVFRGVDKNHLPASQQQWATQRPLVGPAPSAKLAHIDVAFRSGTIVCSGAKSDNEIGDTLIVNPVGTSRTLPLTEKAVEAEGWRRGSCFDGMGWHWFLDTAVGGGKMSHMADNLFPVITMYHKGEVNAIFFASTNNQVGTFFSPANEGEPFALSDYQMCKNMCDRDCTFAGTNIWSTLHIYFRNHNEVACDNSLACGLTFPFRGNCCEAIALLP